MSQRTTLGLVFLLLAGGVFDLASASNDNNVTISSKCEGVLLHPAVTRLTFADARVVSDLGRTEAIDAIWARKASLPPYLDKIQDPDQRAQFLKLNMDLYALHGAFPRVRLGSEGGLITLNEAPADKASLAASSPDGRYVVAVGSKIDSPVRVIEVATGKAIVERATGNDGSGRRGIHVTFSQDSEFAVFRIRDRMEIHDLRRPITLVGSYDLESVRREYGDGLLRQNARGDLLYIPESNAVVAFFDGFPPAELKLWGAPVYKTMPYEDVPEHEFKPATVTGSGIQRMMALAAFTPRYSGEGYLSPSQRTAIARVTAKSGRTYLDLYDVAMRTRRSSIRVESAVGTIQMSPDERYLAVQLTDQPAILVYDLTVDAGLPLWEISLPRTFGEQMAFTGEHALSINSESRGVVLEFRLR